ncbi:MAG: thiamine-phosphate kinase [Pseudomonadota bacterium]|nr:thiamine-phosphate kinase [Pseudomonadota bacterium]
MNEFALIDSVFKRLEATSRDALTRRDGGLPPVLGIGDDGALLTVPPGQQLVVAADTLAAGVHFPFNTPPADIGYKALAVNLSDLAAMGAQPAWFTLCLTLPRQASAGMEAWLRQFCAGMEALIAAEPICLVGGDTTSGPLTISVQVMGLVPAGQALCRRGARAGDDLYVSGQVGAAAAALQWVLEGRPDRCPPALLQRLNRPRPRVALGLALRDKAHACIDISDGLLADLNHVLAASGCGARLDLATIPAVSELPLEAAITGGDDYELCFSAPPSQREALQALAVTLDLPLTRIGEVSAEPGLVTSAGEPLTASGYQHF